MYSKPVYEANPERRGGSERCAEVLDTDKSFAGKPGSHGICVCSGLCREGRRDLVAQPSRPLKACWHAGFAAYTWPVHDAVL